jgi:protein phosphatase
MVTLSSIPTKLASVVIRGAARTDIGRTRRENQDAFGVFPALALYVVADGMGGHAAGGVASTMTIESIRRSLEEAGDEDLTPVIDAAGSSSVGGRHLMIALYQANERVLEASRRDASMKGMGTTVAALLFDPRYEVIAICHVGDSRVYRIRGEDVEQLTEDHTLVQRLLKEGKIEADEVATSPHRHVLTQALGVEELVRPDLRLEKPLPGDLFVLSSDGVHDAVGREEIGRVVRAAYPDLDRACADLVDLANARGGRDNSTVVVVHCGAAER